MRTFVVGVERVYGARCIVCAPVGCAKLSKANIGVAEIQRTWFMLASVQRVFFHIEAVHAKKAVFHLHSGEHAVCCKALIAVLCLEKSYMKKWLPGKMALFSPSPPSCVWFSRKFGVTRTTELRRLRNVREFFFPFLERVTFLCPCAPHLPQKQCAPIIFSFSNMSRIKLVNFAQLSLLYYSLGI